MTSPHCSRSSCGSTRRFIRAEHGAEFEVLERLGRGSFGSVYRVARVSDGYVAVVKKIDLEGLSSVETQAALREVSILQDLDNEFIVPYKNSFVDDNHLCIVMGYCANGDLQQFLAARKGIVLPELQVWSFFIQAALGLFYIHSQRILHRDFKSANVFLGEQSRTLGFKLQIGDLGVARVLGSQSNFAKTIVGTPYYLSPELCEDKPYNEKSDIWALGVVLYECATLRRPFNAKNQFALIHRIVQGRFDSVTGYSVKLCQLVDLLLRRNCARRPNAETILQLPVVRKRAAELGFELPVDAPSPSTLRRARMRSTLGSLSSASGRRPASSKSTASASSNARATAVPGVASHGATTPAAALSALPALASTARGRAAARRDNDAGSDAEDSALSSSAAMATVASAAAPPPARRRSGDTAPRRSRNERVGVHGTGASKMSQTAAGFRAEDGGHASKESESPLSATSPAVMLSPRARAYASKHADLPEGDSDQRRDADADADSAFADLMAPVERPPTLVRARRVASKVQQHAAANGASAAAPSVEAAVSAEVGSEAAPAEHTAAAAAAAAAKAKRAAALAASKKKAKKRARQARAAAARAEAEAGNGPNPTRVEHMVISSRRLQSGSAGSVADGGAPSRRARRAHGEARVSGARHGRSARGRGRGGARSQRRRQCVKDATARGLRIDGEIAAGSGAVAQAVASASADGSVAAVASSGRHARGGRRASKQKAASDRLKHKITIDDLYALRIGNAGDDVTAAASGEGAAGVGGGGRHRAARGGAGGRLEHLSSAADRCASSTSGLNVVGSSQRVAASAKEHDPAEPGAASEELASRSAAAGATVTVSRSADFDSVPEWAPAQRRAVAGKDAERDVETADLALSDGVGVVYCPPSEEDGDGSYSSDGAYEGVSDDTGEDGVLYEDDGTAHYWNGDGETEEDVGGEATLRYGQAAVEWDITGDDDGRGSISNEDGEASLPGSPPPVSLPGSDGDSDAERREREEWLQSWRDESSSRGATLRASAESKRAHCVALLGGSRAALDDAITILEEGADQSSQAFDDLAHFLAGMFAEERGAPGTGHDRDRYLADASCAAQAIWSYVMVKASYEAEVAQLPDGGEVTYGRVG